ncbi:antA/AntB antirepressor family protein [Pectobacterium brasiliense]|uniref:antA/AntB antirepressor family protein n=1 Tax=Pectobacterium brasiliense TaxID=180957 RepID=UPI0015DF6CB6|nr:antA/AntB antirepressor family protein [Pectobacterium brasiliense]MBA0216273.1 antA/AntB antirepressor family protein [Pectobacterium brasiliense]MBN3074085.1 antA/AntB antirepressor family protein [Pectobacterium brasiliense]MBN3171561.1 antA/AntB antirepressor family protein [Pectobacterium brasiliense]
MTKKKITALTGSGQTQSENSQKNIFNEIIPLSMGTIDGKANMVADARNLHKFLGNKERFASWIKQRIEQYKFAENVDYETFSESTEKGRPRIEYRITSDMAKELSMVERTDRGKEARQYFIDCEERLRRVAPEEHQVALLNWRKNRVAACEDHKSMANAMKGYIERTGDKQHGFAYSNECSFLNDLVLGVHPRTWAKQKGIAIKQVRDHMNADQLALLAYLGNRDCALLDLDTPTITRKAKLTELAQRWLAKRLLGGADAK